MAKVEIIPPARSVAHRANHVSAPVVPPRMNPGGLLSSTLVRREATRHARVFSAVAERVRAEASLFDAQTLALESHARRQRAAARVQELPEMIANDRAVRRVERAVALRQSQHQHEIAEARRQTELAHADQALVDARQALRAQREHGYDGYVLEWRKRASDLLEVELTMEERKAILREHRANFSGGENGNGLPRSARDDEVEEALHEARTQLRASGLDTGKIDAVLARRTKK